MNANLVLDKSQVFGDDDDSSSDGESKASEKTNSEKMFSSDSDADGDDSSSSDSGSDDSSSESEMPINGERQPMSPVKIKKSKISEEKIPGKGKKIKIVELEGIAKLDQDGQTTNGVAQKKKKRAPSGSPKKGKPSYADMIKDAIFRMQERKGASLAALRKYIQANNKGLSQKFNVQLSMSLKKLVKSREVVKDGARYKLSANTKRVMKLAKDKEKRAEIRKKKIAAGLIKPKVAKSKSVKKRSTPKEGSSSMKLDPEMEKKRRELLKQKKKLMLKLKKEQEKKKARDALPKPMPARSDMVIPTNIFSDVVAVAEFCDHFSSVSTLKLSSFTAEMLFKAIALPECTVLIRELHMVCLDLILDPAHCRDSCIARMDWYEILNVVTWQEILRCYLVRAMYLLGENYPEYDALGNAVYRLNERGYPSLTTKSKIAVLRVLLDDCLGTKTIADAIDSRLEKQTNLAKAKFEVEKADRESVNELKKKRKEIVGSRDGTDGQNEANKKTKTESSAKNKNDSKPKSKNNRTEKSKSDDEIMAELKANDAKVAEFKKKRVEREQAYKRDKHEFRTRQHPWGMDARGNTFWTFSCDRKKLFVHGCGLKGEKSSMSPRWRYYGTILEINKLMASLDQTNPVELKLHKNLTIFFKVITGDLPKEDERTIAYAKNEEEKKRKREEAAKERKRKKEEAKAMALKEKENGAQKEAEASVTSLENANISTKNEPEKENLDNVENTSNSDTRDAKADKKETQKEFAEILRKIRPQRSSARRAQAAIRDSANSNNSAEAAKKREQQELEKKQKQKKEEDEKLARKRLFDDPDGFLKYLNYYSDYNDEEQGIEVLNLEFARNCRTLEAGEHIDTVMNWIIAQMCALAQTIDLNGGTNWGEWKNIETFKQQVEDLYNLCANSEGTKIPKNCKVKLSQLLFAIETACLPVIEEAEKKEAERLEQKRLRKKQAKERAKKRKKKKVKKKKRKDDDETSSEDEFDSSSEDESDEEGENEHDIHVLEAKYDAGTLVMVEVPLVRKVKKVYDGGDEKKEAEEDESKPDSKDDLELTAPKEVSVAEEEFKLVSGVIVGFRPACLVSPDSAFDAWEVQLETGEQLLLREDKLKLAIKRGHFEAKRRKMEKPKEEADAIPTEEKESESVAEPVVNALEYEEASFREEPLWPTESARSLWVSYVENVSSCSSGALVVYQLSRQIFHRNLYAFPKKLRKSQYVQTIT